MWTARRSQENKEQPRDTLEINQKKQKVRMSEDREECSGSTERDMILLFLSRTSESEKGRKIIRRYNNEKLPKLEKDTNIHVYEGYTSLTQSIKLTGDR